MHQAIPESRNSQQWRWRSRSIATRTTHVNWSHSCLKLLWSLICRVAWLIQPSLNLLIRFCDSLASNDLKRQVNAIVLGHALVRPRDRHNWFIMLRWFILNLVRRNRSRIGAELGFPLLSFCHQEEYVRRVKGTVDAWSRTDTSKSLRFYVKSARLE